MKIYRKQGDSLEDAIHKSVKECINEDVLKSFLEEYGTEVLNMLFTEFNLEDAKKVWLEEGIEKGREEGIKSEKKTIAFALLDILDSETISEKTGLSIQEIEEMRKQ